MKIFQRYIITNYIKNFFIIFLGLELFYVGIDLLTNYKELPDSANLQILYLSFKMMDAINYTLPLSLVFSMIVTKFAMIKSNELITLYAVGISKNSVLKPIFLSSFIISILYIGLNFTPFAYSYEYSRNLLKYSVISNNSTNLFLKDENNYIFFEELDPLKKSARGIEIFEILNNDLAKIISAKEGYFNEDRWVLKNVTITSKQKIETLTDQGLEVSYVDKYETLKDFKPKIIENVHQGKYTLSTIDAIDALIFFNSQGINTDRIKTIIYSQTFFPLFAPLLVVVLFYYLPISSRFFDYAFLTFVFILVTLLTWGFLFLLSRLSYSSVIVPEIALLLPILILGTMSLRYYYSNS
ncbi:MAG TPA: permease [Sulfurospirillum sp. UBA12182]|jgi:lipopolysaccharide export system permease protein|nr:MAG TPA: permease [Sulfurospirillum sp. UBA12182]